MIVGSIHRIMQLFTAEIAVNSGGYLREGVIRGILGRQPVVRKMSSGQLAIAISSLTFLPNTLL